MNKNLANPEIKKVLEELGNGKKPNGGVKAIRQIYKHPIKNRQIIKSNVQRKALRRG